MVNNKDLLEHIIGIKEDVAAINSHLKDMNGKLVKHDRFIDENCPARHSNLSDRIKNLEVSDAKKGVIIGIAVSLVTLAASALVQHLFF